MTANVNNILRQIDTVSDQVLGLAVLSSEFEKLFGKSTYDRLLLYRKITSQLTNICISNDTIDNIYILILMEMVSVLTVSGMKMFIKRGWQSLCPETSKENSDPSTSQGSLLIPWKWGQSTLYGQSADLSEPIHTKWSNRTDPDGYSL